MKRIKIGLLVLGLVVISLLVMSAGSIPTLAGSPNPAVPTITLPTPAPTKPVTKPAAGATSPARVATRVLVAPTATKPAAPKIAPSIRGSTSKSLSTNFTLVNLATITASVSVNFVKTDGSAWNADAANTSFNVGPDGGQKIVRQYSPYESTMTTGQGSAVVSSSQPLGAVVQILARNQTPTNGAYSGVSQTSSTYYVPLVMRQLTGASGLSNSQIMIQNAGTSALTNVTVQFIGTTNYTKPAFTIQPGATFYYDVADETNLPVGWYGSAVVGGGSGSSLAVIVNLFAGSDTLQTYNAFPAENLGTAWFVPLFASRLVGGGLSTPIAVQNLSGSQIAIGAVTATCTKDPASAGTNFTMSNTTTIANNGAYYFNPVIDMTIQGNWYGSCKVTSTGGNIVSFVQMRNIGTSNAAAYEAINANGTNKNVFIPLVAKRLGGGFATAVTIQNLASAIAHITLTYTPSPDYIASGGSAAVLSTTTTIPASGSLIQNQRLSGFSVGATAMPDGWYGTLKVTSSDQPIDGFVQLTNINALPGDNTMAHNAFTQP